MNSLWYGATGFHETPVEIFFTSWNFHGIMRDVKINKFSS